MSPNQIKRRKEAAQLTYPLHMQIKGKPCLVIGGGKVAQRKTERLVRCCAKVTVIAKSLTSKLRKMSEAGKITVCERGFRSTDIKQKYRLVFAATDDSELNKKITGLCHDNGILICSVDFNWVDGSFITPASFAKDGLTVSVASGGKSCRRSKLLTKNINKHFTALELSELVVIGTDHNCLTLSEREKIHPDNEQLIVLAEMLNGISAMHEFMILNTCNRFELIAIAHKSDVLVKMLVKLMGFDRLEENSFYIKSGYEAFKHTSMLASGILSQNTGETYIASQMKESLKAAKKHDWADGIIQDWIDKSLHISKDIRNELFLSDKKEIDELISEYLDSNFSSLNKKTLMILGSGNIGKAVYKALKKHGFKKIIWFYRSRKPKVISDENVETVKLNSLKEKIKDADILVSALSSSNPVIDSSVIKELGSKKRLFIDLGIPRNIEASEKTVNPAVDIINMNQVQDNIKPKKFAVLKKKAVEVVDEHEDMFIKIMDSFK